MTRITAKPIMIPVGAGELIDRITILRIKSARMTDPIKLRHVREELRMLSDLHASSLPPGIQIRQLEQKLMEVNETLWDIEDDIRACEAAREFGPRFIALARSVYRQNDTRAELKKKINLLCGSDVIEEKSYADYD